MVREEREQFIVRSSYRDYTAPGSTYYDIGFRVARNP
jgi:formylglycine-generating enzyme required for sulfatase activity